MDNYKVKNVNVSTVCYDLTHKPSASRRLTYLTGRYNLISGSQFGGRANSSTSDAILTFVHDIHNSWNHGLATSVLTFDIKGYFDFVNHERLLNEMKKRRIPLKLVK